MHKSNQMQFNLFMHFSSSLFLFFKLTNIEIEKSTYKSSAFISSVIKKVRIVMTFIELTNI